MRAAALLVITVIVYFVSNKGEGAAFNYHVLLADAFLNGRLDFRANYSWMEIVIHQGKYYTVFPPGPAFLFMPLVAIFGTEFYQPVVSIVLGGANVALCYLVLEKILSKWTNSTKGLYSPRAIAMTVSLLYAFGTIQWYHAEVGSGWYVSHIIAMTFMWLAIWCALLRKNYFWVGLLVGGAYLARLPTVLSVFFIFFYFIEDFLSWRGRIPIPKFKNGLLLAAGFVPAFLTNVGYNYFRWGVPYDLGYDLLPIHNEPWYRFGLFSVKYIPEHLAEMFLAMPTIVHKPPYVIPSLFALSILIVTPAYLLILRAPLRERAFWAALVTTFIAAFPSLAHGGNGFTQFGYRHTLDYMPFLLILVAGGVRRTPFWVTWPLVFASVLVNLWGVIMISHMNLWDMSTRTLLDYFR